VNAGDVEALFGIELAVGLAETPALLESRNAAPGTIRDFENLGQQLLRRAVAFERDERL